MPVNQDYLALIVVTTYCNDPRFPVCGKVLDDICNGNGGNIALKLHWKLSNSLTGFGQNTVKLHSLKEYMMFWGIWTICRDIARFRFELIFQ